MKRSEINEAIREAADIFKKVGFHLPPFAWWTMEDWKKKGEEYDEIRDNLMGWDVADFGSGDYNKIGLLSFTIRNGNYDLEKYVKPYCEKVLLQRENQYTPYHYHYKKIEDIINRGGGILNVQLYNHTEDDEMADTDLHISTDGHNYTAPAGTIVRLEPGQSITIFNGMYHQFWAEGGPVVVGEVSKPCDDRTDNHFYVPGNRFPVIEEDEEPLYPLCTEYPKAQK